MEVLDFGNHSVGPSRWRPSGLAIGALIAVLAVGLGVGFAVGHHRVHSAATSSAQSKPDPARPNYPIAATGNTCSDQLGDRLELGVEVLNPSSVTVVLDRLSAVLPLPGLRPEVAAVGTCGQVTDAPAFLVARLRPGATTWVTMTFDVQVRCPSALPVQFRLAYHHGHRHSSSRLDEFPDLGRVSFSRCAPVPKLLPER